MRVVCAGTIYMTGVRVHPPATQMEHMGMDSPTAFTSVGCVSLNSPALLQTAQGPLVGRGPEVVDICL